MIESMVPVVITMVLAGAAVSWVQKRFRPGLPLGRRLMVVAVGAVVGGGMIYGAIFSR